MNRSTSDLAGSGLLVAGRTFPPLGDISFDPDAWGISTANARSGFPPARAAGIGASCLLSAIEMTQDALDASVLSRLDAVEHALEVWNALLDARNVDLDGAVGSVGLRGHAPRLYAGLLLSRHFNKP